MTTDKELDALVGRLNDAEQHSEDDCYVAASAISALRKERDRLREALEKYGECKPKCTTWEDAPHFKGVINSGPCSCGYVAALAPQEPTT